MRAKRITRYLISIGITIGVAGVPAFAGPGSCENFAFPYKDSGEVDWPHAVKVLRQNAAVYPDAMAVSASESLNFSESLQVLDVQATRVQVGNRSTLAPIGWVEKVDLLCAISPLKSEESGLEQKLYIRTDTEVRQEKPATVAAYPAPDLQDYGTQVRELSRFEGYFVFDTDQANGSYLLAEDYKLYDTSRLVGWVNKDNGFIWDTAYGTRPREDLVFPPDHELAGQEKTVCAYKNLEDAINNPVQTCLPILGGERWYESDHRIPILERIKYSGQDFYKVVLPLAGTGATYDKEEGKIKIIQPGDFTQNVGIDSLKNMKNVDVLFLIDGTKSLTRHIDEVRGVDGSDGIVQQIKKALEEEDAYRETDFRFGFRIYRDTYAGDRELGDGLPMNDRCELTETEKKEWDERFDRAIRSIEVTSEGRDDYAENLFGGIQQAIRDLAPCPNNTKLLFIIGDCGYDATAQRNRGITPIEPGALVNRMQSNEQQGVKTLVPFFIQTPLDRSSAKNPAEYEQAYHLFTQQAREITGRLSDPDEMRNYVLESRAEDLKPRILAGVKNFGNAQVINDIIIDLRGGTALTEAIERLRGSEEYNNLPGLFWDLVKQGSCAELGEQCENRVYDTIFEAYLPISDELVEDVWLKSDDMDKFTGLLREFDADKLAALGGTQLRETFVYAMKDSLENVIRKPLYEDTDEPLKVYLKRKGGLPVREKSPLFNYSVDDLADPDSVPDCEIIRLTSWVNSAKRMLNIIYHGDLRPIYREEPFPGECPVGQNIPFISEDIQSGPLGPDKRYDHSFQAARVYWVPDNFLP